MRAILSKVLYGLKLIEDNAAPYMLAVLALLVVINVFLRNIHLSGLAWNEEISVILLIWFVLFGAMQAERLGNQMVIGAFAERVSGIPRQVLHVVITIAVLCFLVILTKGSLDLFLASQDEKTDVLHLPSHIVWTLPVLIAVVTIISHIIYREVSGIRRHLSKQGTPQCKK